MGVPSMPWWLRRKYIFIIEPTKAPKMADKD